MGRGSDQFAARRGRLTWPPCGCCTPPTGTWDGCSTAGTCSPTRRPCSAGWPTWWPTSGSTSCVVAGDLYDRAVPSGEAVPAAPAVLDRIRAAGARSSSLRATTTRPRGWARSPSSLAAGGLHLRTRSPSCDRPVLLDDEHGPVALYGIPYLEPEPARHSLGSRRAGARRRCSTEAMRRVRADLAARGAGRPVGRARARVRHRRRSRARLGADDRGRRRRAGAGARVRRRRLRGARSPARAAARWPSTCGTPGARWRTRSPRRGTASRCGWSTSTPAGSPVSSGVELPVPRRSPR